LRLSLIILSICCTGVFFVDFAVAAVYKYENAQGIISFTNVPVHGRYRYYQAEPGDVSKPLSIVELIKHYAIVYRLDSNLVRAIVRAESNFDPNAVSQKGAIGLMQLHPETIKDLQLSDPFKPASNIAGGTRYLRQMLNRFNGDIDLALAAYNAGPATVERYKGVPPYPETLDYIQRVKNFLQHYRQGGS
jgi:soluble lytic murein transglycosylase